MRSRALLLAAGLAAALLLATTVAVGGLLILRERSLPVYTFAQEPSPGSERVTETLTLHGVVYVSSLGEFALDPVGRSRQIGRTADGMRIYAPAGQAAARDYLYLTGFMFPQVVYRRADVPAFDPRTFPLGELQLAANVGGLARLHRTSDQALLAELQARLQEPGPLIPAAGPYETYRVALLSPRVPGVSYFLYLTVAADGQVLLAHKASPEAWFAAGERLSQWARSVTAQMPGADAAGPRKGPAPWRRLCLSWRGLSPA